MPKTWRPLRSAPSSRSASARARTSPPRREGPCTAPEGRHPGREPAASKALGIVWRALRGLLVGVAALVIFVEEWGWRPLAALAARLARWAPIARLETRVAGASPRWALALFLIPAVLLFPVKLAALWLIDAGRPWLGVGIILTAKLVGTALVGRLFVLVERQLMSFPWFARGVDWWRGVRDRVRAIVHGSLVWRRGRVWRRAFRQWRRKAVG